MPSSQIPASAHKTFCHLASGVSARDVAHASRSVALAFLNGVAGGWGKAELAAWLSGPYAGVTRFAAGPTHGQSDPPAGQSAPPLGADDIATVLRDARWRALAALEAASGTGANYATTARARGLVVPCLDDGGHHGFAAASATNARLHDRVLALFAVDRLVNPTLHRDALYVCSRCERVVVDAATKERGVCTAHGPTAPMGRMSDARRGDTTRVTKPYAYPALEHMGPRPT